MKKVSFIIPCYRSENTISHVVTEITDKMQQMARYEYEIVLVNDCSPDGTLASIRRLCEEHQNVKGISFARNFGQIRGFDGGTSTRGWRLCGMFG